MFAFAREGRNAMNEQKIGRMLQLAKRVADKPELSEPFFSVRQGGFLSAQVSVLTEGRLRNQLFATWIPITKEAYNDQKYRRAIVARAHRMWRVNAIHALLPLELLQGPKGKLPA